MARAPRKPRLRVACDDCGRRPGPGDTWRAGKRADGKNRCPECRPATRPTPERMTCPTCDVEKPAADFYTHKKGGLTGPCRSCVLIRRRVDKYGVDHDEYLRRYEEQAGCCAICRQHFETLAIDHSHATGCVRALLCKNCNTGIGMLGDDVDRLVSAMTYLLLHQEEVHDAGHPHSIPS